ncbi:MAG: hypothetical protein KatS3mg103_1429 [Phycisphaerales bacterium]|nr:MAG: hypothetical protein KatS3mg103_1429 [Phycisphaerales bacterium]
MTTARNTFARLARAAACALAVLVCTHLAIALDRVTLTDGRVVEGEIARELNGSVWLKTPDGLTQFFPASQVLRIERDVEPAPTPGQPGTVEPAPAAPQAPANPATPATTRPAEQPQPRQRPASPGAPRAAVLSFGDADNDMDMVGTYLTAQSLRECIPLLEEEDVDIVVLRVNSGGGAIIEIKRISDLLHNEFKPRFRTVAWVDYAISAAAMTPHCLSEIYFMRRGAYGASTGWYGALQAVAGRDLEEVLYLMELISERGGHDPKIMRAMQIMEPLSVDLDENGRVEAMYQNTEGEVVINKPERVLTLNSQTAQTIGFATGIADTLDELAKAMGLTEVVWVGEHVPGVPWPVSKADRHLRRFREQTARDEQSINQYFEGYQIAVELARQAPREDRGKFIGFARRNLASMVRMVDNNPNLALFIFNSSEEDFRRWVREQEELLRELAK